MRFAAVTAAGVSLLPAVLGGNIELRVWSAPGNPSFQTCSAYITDVHGCTGWSENFCKSLTRLDQGCETCEGTNTATACGSAAVTMNFDTGLMEFANNNGDMVSCTMPGGGDLGGNGYKEGQSCSPP